MGNNLAKERELKEQKEEERKKKEEENKKRQEDERKKKEEENKKQQEDERKKKEENQKRQEDERKKKEEENKRQQEGERKKKEEENKRQQEDEQKKKEELLNKQQDEERKNGVRRHSHNLVKLEKAPYASGAFSCDVCSANSDGEVFHCKDCGPPGYDECPQCFSNTEKEKSSDDEEKEKSPEDEEKEYLLSISKPNQEFVEEQLQPMIDKLLITAKENDFYEFLGMNQERSKTIFDIQSARREKAVQCHPDHAETEEQKKEFADTYAKISNICQNYLLDEKVKQVYDTVDEYRVFYSKIGMAQYKNLLQFYDRTNNIWTFLTSYGPQNQKDLSVLQEEMKMLMTVLEATLKNINPSWQSPQQAQEDPLAKLLDFFILMRVLESLKEN